MKSGLGDASNRGRSDVVVAAVFNEAALETGVAPHVLESFNLVAHQIDHIDPASVVGHVR
jgi:hypothetical protein